MKMYYITRYEHNDRFPTQYYCGNGQWCTMFPGPNNRISLRLYANEKLAMSVIENITEGDWHEIYIEV